jgi:plastocyanin
LKKYLIMLVMLASCAQPDPPATATINIVDLSFTGSPSIAVGEPLTIVNSDTVAHTWTAVDFSFNSGNINPGAQHTHTFDAAGDYAYFCEIHPEMTGSVTVTP